MDGREVGEKNPASSPRDPSHPKLCAPDRGATFIRAGIGAGRILLPPSVFQMNLRPYIALAFLTQVVGCASIVGGTEQSISVETRNTAGPVPGANCKLENDKGTWFVTTPGSTTVHRAYGDLKVNCDKDGHVPGAQSAKSSTKGLAFGNILFGGVIGVGVDAATGAAYDYPALITVVLEPVAAPKAEVPASVVVRSVAMSADVSDAAPSTAPSASAATPKAE